MKTSLFLIVKEELFKAFPNLQWISTLFPTKITPKRCLSFSGERVFFPSNIHDEQKAAKEIKLNSPIRECIYLSIIIE